LLEKVILTISLFVVFWFVPAYLVNFQIDYKTQDAEQILKGHMVLWVHHDKTICGCLATQNPQTYRLSKVPKGRWAFGLPKQTQFIECDCNDRYLSDDMIRWWAKGNHIP
jgi:hypothetical protein